MLSFNSQITVTVFYFERLWSHESSIHQRVQFQLKEDYNWSKFWLQQCVSSWNNLSSAKTVIEKTHWHPSLQVSGHLRRTDACLNWALDEAGAYYYSWETWGDAGMGTRLTDSDQMGVPTRCFTATKIDPRRLLHSSGTNCAHHGRDRSSLWGEP